MRKTVLRDSKSGRDGLLFPLYYLAKVIQNYYFCIVRFRLLFVSTFAREELLQAFCYI
jgi:hypothetical protein